MQMGVAFGFDFADGRIAITAEMYSLSNILYLPPLASSGFWECSFLFFAITLYALHQAGSSFPLYRNLD